MSIEDKRRAAFYEWFDAEVAPNITGCRAVIFAMCEHGWNAALDKVLIELPSIETDHPIEIDAQADMRSRCREAIESAGLKVRA